MAHTIERTALLKVLLHAIKYPAYGVNGVLLGSISKGKVTAVDAVPLVHNFITLVPAFETALCQVGHSTTMAPRACSRLYVLSHSVPSVWRL